MGRNAKPFSMHVLDGNRNKHSKEKLEKMEKADKKLRFKDDNIKAPYWLSTRAKNIFNKLVAEFEGMNLITNVDVNMIALYSDAFASYIDYTERIKKDGIIVTSLNNGGFEQEDVNPLIAKKEKAFAMIEKAGSKLGLSPVDRAKMVGLMMEDDKDEDKGNSRFSGRL
jgi:P27 family predicted phage terminase small subunit